MSSHRQRDGSGPCSYRPLLYPRSPHALLGCLRDLRKLWREDSDDPDRTISHVFAQVGVFQNLIPLFLKTAGGGPREEKIALACTDLLTSITWPVDAYADVRAAEARGMSTEHFARLLRLEQGMIAYKAATLRTGSGETVSASKNREVLGTVMRYILMPSLVKQRHQRTERDLGTISMVLHLFRNLLAIRDPPATSLSSNEEIANSTLQSDLVCAMAKSHVLEAILMLADNADRRDFEQWNAITAEIVYMLFGGQCASIIAGQEHIVSGTFKGQWSMPGDDSSVQPTSRSSALLSSSLNAEAHQRHIAQAALGTSRHSRFGTTLNFFTSDGQRRVARNASALRKSVTELRQDNAQKNRRNVVRQKRAREQGAPRMGSEWTPAAKAVLRDWADKFLLSGGFNTLSHSIFQDIRSERAKLGDLNQARVRIMLLSVFFLEYFLIKRTAEDHSLAEAKKMRAPLVTSTAPVQQAASGSQKDGGELSRTNENSAAQPAQSADKAGGNEAQEQEANLCTWSFSFLAHWLKPWAFRMVSTRSAEALESKLWLELEAALQVWTSWLKMVDYMSRKGTDVERDVAESLQANHFYDSETLHLCLEVARCYTSQSLQFLERVVAFLNYMPRMLEKYSTNEEHTFYRAKRHVRKARSTRVQDGSDTLDDDGVPLCGTQGETKAKVDEMYTDRRFNFHKFQNKLCTRPLVNACVGYLGRWRDFTLPAEQLGNVVGVLHRIAIKAGEVRMFYPEHIRLALSAISKGPIFAALQPQASQATGDCKKLIEYCLRRYEKLPQEQKDLWAFGKAAPRPPKKNKMPREVQVKPGFSRDEQVGVAIGLLAEQNKMGRVMWIKAALENASAQRLQTVFNVEKSKMWEAAKRQKEADGETCGEEPTAEENEAMMDAIAEAVASEDSVAQFQPYDLGYDGDAELRNEATFAPPVKLLCRLMGLESDEDDESHWKWRVPAHILPTHLDADVQLIENYIRSPFSIEAANFELLTQNVRKPRAMKARHLAPEDVGPNNSNDDESSSDSGSGSDADLSAEQGEVAGQDKKRRGHRRREDLLGDKRQKKGFRRKSASSAPLFLADDIIESDEEGKVDRLWAEQQGQAASKAKAVQKRTASPASRPRPRAVAAGRPMSEGSDDDDDEMRRWVSSPRRNMDTPPTSPVVSDHGGAKDRSTAKKVRKSNGLFFSSDSENEASSGENDEGGGRVPVTSPGADTSDRDDGTPRSRRRVLYKRAASAVVADSDEEEDDDDAGECNGPTAARSTSGDARVKASHRLHKRPRPTFSSAFSALADSD